MAKVTVKTNFDFKTLKDWQKQTNRGLAKLFKETIVSEIKKGLSPVRGEGRFVRYSKAYREMILKNRLPFPKKRAPVNLTLSGDMLKSIFVDIKQFGFDIGFKSFLADIHNKQGAGRSKILRRMLPTNRGEEFNKSIQVDVQKFLDKARTRLINKINN